MFSKYLNSAALVAVTLGMSAPLPAYSQNKAERPFPCVAPDGSEVKNRKQLAKALEAYIAAGEVMPVTEGCTEEAYERLKKKDLKSLMAAVEAAPAEMQDQLLPLLEGESLLDTATDAVGAAVDAITGNDAAEESAEAAEPAAEVDAEVEAEAETPAADPAPQASEQGAENASDQSAVAEAQGDQAPEATEPAVDPAPENGGAAEATADPAAEAPAEADTASETETPAQSEGDAAAAAETGEADAAAEAEASGAGEAGGTQLSDEERQAREAEREAEANSAAAAAGEADAEGEATEQEAEVTTQTVTEEDVRRSDEDFKAPVTGDTAAAAKDDSKRSDFEKAVLLGLGAALVGSILDNGDEVVSNTGDRIVVQRDGELRILKNDDTLLQRPGAEVQTKTFNDGSSRTTVTYEDGSQIVTVRAADGSVLRRTYVRPEDGQEVVLFDDTEQAEQIDFERLPTLEELRAAEREAEQSQQEDLDRALQRALLADVDRRFSLRQVRDYKRVRALAPQVELDAVTFASGSAAIEQSQAEGLVALGQAMRDVIDRDPSAVFLVEGHTDAVGQASYNLALSDRRAETVALALTEYFQVPPQNLVIQGYGETDLKVSTLEAERANRRAVVRNITELLR